jgi:NAD-dependent SIR2 family protein deacetylase
MSLKMRTGKSTEDYSDNIMRLKEAIDEADTVVIGAGAGLSTAAGFTYSGKRFREFFSDFSEKYGFQDMYSGGFYPYETLEEYWTYWSRYIYINRYMNPSVSVYDKLYNLVKDKDYFVLTTNVDHCFQRAGFDKNRMFYTQGDYGLLQCSKPCHMSTYDNEALVRQMVEAQGYVIEIDGALTLSDDVTPQMSVPTELIPYCPKCGAPMSMNLRADDTFVEDEGWHLASERYADFLRTRSNQKVLFLELGVGSNTPGIIKYPFWQMVQENSKAVYACLNFGEAYAPKEIASRSILIDGDINEILAKLL